MVSWLVVGLGNPDAQYELSPHNLGFMTIDRLAKQYGIRVTHREAHARTGQGEVEGHPVLLAKPQTYMNLSGRSVGPLLEKHGGSLVVVYDEHNLPWGALRIRQRGSAGGHHGMESVIAAVGTDEFLRVRLGINPGGAQRAEPEYLLKPLRREQVKELDGFLDYAAQAVVSIISEGAEKAMTRFNRRAQGENEDE
jgi:PTH1 family peptidyl-tRNA hydrolase